MYFNIRQERSGALFQGKFKASHVDRDAYLAYLIAYIHLNPVKLIEPGWKEAGILDKPKAEEFLREYRWSSYQDYLGEERREKALISEAALPEYWSTRRSFGVFIADWLGHGAQTPSPQPMSTMQQNEREKSLV